jgi:hypothetical protein
VPGDLDRDAVPLQQRGIDIDGDVGQGEDGRRPPTAIITVVALFDWLRRRPAPRGSDTWEVHLDGPMLVAASSRGDSFQATIMGAQTVRVVPLSRGSHHAAASGWQVTLSRPEGDVLLGTPLADWQSAHALAQRVCEQTRLPMDQLTQQLFSRVRQTKLV